MVEGPRKQNGFGGRFAEYVARDGSRSANRVLDDGHALRHFRHSSLFAPCVFNLGDFVFESVEGARSGGFIPGVFDLAGIVSKSVEDTTVRRPARGMFEKWPGVPSETL